MKFIKLLLLSMALGHIARPFLLSENADKLAAVCLGIWLVMTAVLRTEKQAPIHHTTARLLKPLRHPYVMPAVIIYSMSWVYARTTLSQFVADLLRG